MKEKNQSMLHHFIFSPGVWLGEGTVLLNLAKEELKYVTKFTVRKEKDSQIEVVQEIQIAGLSDLIKNQFYFYNIKPDRFKIRLESQNLGQLDGEGILKKSLLAWEFRIPEVGFEGFEVYNLSEDDVYLMNAEYTTNQDYRSKVRGKIWKKVSDF